MMPCARSWFGFFLPGFTVCMPPTKPRARDVADDLRMPRLDSASSREQHRPERAPRSRSGSRGRIFFTLASAAAQQTGLPVCVLVIEPGGNWSMISARPITAESGSELLMPLPQQIRSGATP